MKYASLLCLTQAYFLTNVDSKQPHIILILADDLGWNEVSWHNPLIHTPRMEELSAKGVRLEKSYVHSKCSPSRAALLTGRYAWRLGIQRAGVGRFQPTGLNTSVKILPEYLKEGGYSAHMVGKWHLGFCHDDYLPTSRGFDSFFGQYNHHNTYYTRIADWSEYSAEQRGYDLRKNKEVTYEGKGEFSPDLYTRKAVEVIETHNASEPLFLYVAFQAPHEPIDEAPPEKYRKVYRTRKIHGRVFDDYATITALDSGIGDIHDALVKHGLYDNSVMIFSTDNGGPPRPKSNYPLKGHKEQVFEGGVRGVGFVNSPLLQDKGVTSNRMMFITDWFSTILDLAGVIQKVPSDIDSYSMWPSLSMNRKSPRNQIVINVDQDLRDGLWSTAIIKDEFKLIWGQDFLLKQPHPENSCATQLYNLKKDPVERENLVVPNEKGWVNKKYKLKVKELKELIIKEFRSERFVEGDRPPNDHKGWPGNFGGNLSPGWCDAKV